MIGAIDETNKEGERTLKAVDGSVPEWLDQMVPDSGLVDRESPSAADRLVEEFISPDERHWTGGPILRGVVVLVFLFAFAAAWRWTSFGQWIDVDSISAWEASLRQSPAAPLWVIGAYLVGGLTSFPVTVLIAATAFAFEPWEALTYSLLGCIMSGILMFLIGRTLGRKTVSRLAGRRLNRVNRLLRKHGILAMIAVRMLPVAPYSWVNLAAGAVNVRFRDFVFGTVVGMSPGVTAITLFENQLEEMIKSPSLWTFVILGAILILMLIGVVAFRRWYSAKYEPRPAEASLMRND